MKQRGLGKRYFSIILSAFLRTDISSIFSTSNGFEGFPTLINCSRIYLSLSIRILPSGSSSEVTWENLHIDALAIAKDPGHNPLGAVGETVVLETAPQSGGGSAISRQDSPRAICRFYTAE